MGVSVVLADHRPLIRAGARTVLESVLGAEIAAEVSDVDGCLRAVRALRPDLLVMAASLPPGGAREVCTALADAPETRTLVVADDTEVSGLLALLESGAHGVLTATESAQDLADAATTVADGHAWVPPLMLGGILSGLVARRRQHKAADARYERLSPRERQVLALLAQGGDVAAIAGRLVISPQTARTHIQNVLSKLEVHTRAEAAAFAAEHGHTEVTNS